MGIDQIIGYVAACLTTFAAVPQLVKAIRTKRTTDVSLWYFLVLVIGVSLWVVYGAMIGEWPVILANSVGFVILLAVLLTKLKYG